MKGDVLNNALSCALSCGYELIDTAFKYQNESEIGDVLANHWNEQNKVLVQTKFSVTQLLYRRILWLTYGRKTTKDAIKGSMKRLNKDCLDVYLLHSPSKGYVDFYGELIKYREQGKVKVIGVCKFDEQQLKDIKNAYGEYPSINQIEVHPYHSNKRIIEFCREQGIAVEARSIFTHGDAIDELLHSEILLELSKEYGKTIPQVIVRWIIQQGMIAIVKSQSHNLIKENVDVFDFCLTEKQMSMIDSMNKNQSFGYKSIHFQ